MIGWVWVDSSSACRKINFRWSNHSSFPPKLSSRDDIHNQISERIVRIGVNSGLFYKRNNGLCFLRNPCKTHVTGSLYLTRRGSTKSWALMSFIQAYKRASTRSKILLCFQTTGHEEIMRPYREVVWVWLIPTSDELVKFVRLKFLLHSLACRGRVAL